jgi:hypothetical protein
MNKNKKGKKQKKTSVPRAFTHHKKEMEGKQAKE